MKTTIGKRTLGAALGLVAALAISTSAWAQDPACGQPSSDGDSPTIRDCISIARASIGASSCPDCICDVNGSGDVRITDALHCLLYVIGQDVTLDCPACVATTTTQPSCASCYDVLLGFADEGDLCEAALPFHDALVNCPCDLCGDQCPRLCEAGPEPAANFELSNCPGCVLQGCGHTLSDCIEN